MRETTKVALKAAFAIGLLGFLISRVWVLAWANTQAAPALLFLWYVVFFAFINLTVYWIWRVWDFRTLRASVGVIVLWFAGLIAFYWPASLYTVLVSGQNPANVPTPLLATEDEVVFFGWYSLLGTRSLADIGPYLALVGLVLVAFGLFVMLRTFSRRLVATPLLKLVVALVLFAGVALVFMGLGGYLFGTLWVEGVLTYAFTPAVLVLLAVFILTPKAFSNAIRHVLHVGV